MIYFLRAGNHIKIGWSADESTLANRVCTMQTAQPYKLELIRTVESKRWAERWFHGFFAGLKVSGEWFMYTPDMLCIFPPESRPIKTKSRNRIKKLDKAKIKNDIHIMFNAILDIIHAKTLNEAHKLARAALSMVVGLPADVDAP